MAHEVATKSKHLYKEGKEEVYGCSKREHQVSWCEIRRCFGQGDPGFHRVLLKYQDVSSTVSWVAETHVETTGKCTRCKYSIPCCIIPRIPKEGLHDEGQRKRSEEQRYPGDAELSRVLLLQTVLLQRLDHRKVGCVSGGEQDGLVRDVGLQAVGVYTQCATCQKTQRKLLVRRIIC